MNMDSDDDAPATETSEEEQGDSKRYRTAPATPSRQTSIVGQTTTPRVSPRKSAKKDYKALQNPYTDDEMLDSDGNPLFEKSSGEYDELGSEDELGNTEHMVKEEEVAAAVVV